jgi:hypothetical protein
LRPDSILLVREYTLFSVKIKASQQEFLLADVAGLKSKEKNTMRRHLAIDHVHGRAMGEVFSESATHLLRQRT